MECFPLLILPISMISATYYANIVFLHPGPQHKVLEALKLISFFFSSSFFFKLRREE